MPALLKAAAVIVLLLALLRLKVDLGLALLADAVLTGLLFRLPAVSMLREAGRAQAARPNRTHASIDSLPVRNFR